MNKILPLLLMLVIAVGVNAQGSNVSSKPLEDIALKEISFDFGKIQQGRPVTHEFEIINTGSTTLKLENVQASCGCTTPVWRKDPVAPGGSTKINVGYNAASEGPFEKQVVVYYNEGKTKTITIKGNVYKTPATPAPQNPSIEFLKQTNQ